MVLLDHYWVMMVFLHNHLVMVVVMVMVVLLYYNRLPCDHGPVRYYLSVLGS